MAGEAPKSNERSIAQQTQEKFELYLLTLVFTLLGLAIQSATFGPSIEKSSLELSAWLALLVSGIAELRHLQWNPVLRVHMADRKSLESEILKLKELQLQGQSELLVLETGLMQPIAERIVHRNSAIAMYD